MSAAHMSAAHTLYASYALSVSNGNASPQDLKSLVKSIKDSAKCNCLPCKIITTMCEVCNSEDEYIKSMSMEMIEANAWKLPVVKGEYLCPFGADRTWEIEAAAAAHNNDDDDDEDESSE